MSKQMHKRLIVDMDGVLADVYSQFMYCEESETGVRQPIETINGIPEAEAQQMVFCGSKSAIYGDIMIDDHFKNLDSFNGKTFLFSQPHNMGLPEKNHIRVHSWEEILTLL